MALHPLSVPKSMRNWVLVVSIAVTVGGVTVSAQNSSDGELARLLADSSTRQEAVAKIVASGPDKVRLLLLWTRDPPAQVDESELDLGMTEVFGRLKVKEAIPFLIKNINLQRWPPSPNAWMKTPAVILERFPAVAALIQIGPEASTALMHDFWVHLAGPDRLAAIFVISRIKGVPDAQDFLQQVYGAANLERFRAEEGLRSLREDAVPPK